MTVFKVILVLHVFERIRNVGERVDGKNKQERSKTVTSFHTWIQMDITQTLGAGGVQSV